MNQNLCNSPPPAYEEREPPAYDCTVYKRGHVKLKKEINNGKRDLRRPWRSVYFKLTGTILSIFKEETDDKPMITIPMHRVYCGYPSDYPQKEDVLRMTIADTADQYLVQPTGGLIQVVSWFEHLAAAANISSDIDTRKMPKLVYYNRENTPIIRNIVQHRTATLNVGGVSVYVPIISCLPKVNKSFMIVDFI